MVINWKAMKIWFILCAAAAVFCVLMLANTRPIAQVSLEDVRVFMAMAITIMVMYAGSVMLLSLALGLAFIRVSERIPNRWPVHVVGWTAVPIVSLVTVIVPYFFFGTTPIDIIFRVLPGEGIPNDLPGLPELLIRSGFWGGIHGTFVALAANMTIMRPRREVR